MGSLYSFITNRHGHKAKKWPTGESPGDVGYLKMTKLK